MAARRTSKEASALASSFEDGGAALGLVEAWRVDPAQLFRGSFSCRRRARIQSRRSLGRVPGRWTFNGGFISSVKASVFCGLCQSLLAIELLWLLGRWHPVLVASGDVWRRRRIPVHEGSRDLGVFSLLNRGLCVSVVEQLASVSYVNVLVFVLVPVLYWSILVLYDV